MSGITTGSTAPPRVKVRRKSASPFGKTDATSTGTDAHGTTSAPTAKRAKSIDRDTATGEEKSGNDSQSIHRAFGVLRLVARAGAEGIRLTEVAEAAQLHVATAHRLLGALARERFVNLDPYTRLYRLGFDAMMLAEGAHEYHIKRHYQETLENLARSTEDTVYLSTPSGNDAICIERVEGRYPIRALTLDVGARRPLGVGAGSMALLAWLPPARIDTIVAGCSARYAQYNGLTGEEIRALARATLKRGYAFNNARVMDGVCAVGLPVLSDQGTPLLAISVAAIAPRMQAERRRTIVKAIREAIHDAGPPPTSR